MASSASMEQWTVESKLATYVPKKNITSPKKDRFGCSGIFRGLKLTLDRGQAQLLGNIGVLDLAGLLQGHTADQLGEIGGRSDGAATAEGLEDNVIDLTAVLVDTDLELHDIATGGGTDKTGTNVLVTLLERTDVARVVVVIQDLLVVSTTLGRSSRLSDGLDRLGRLKAGEGRESTGGDNRADARSDGDDTLEHFEGVCVCVV